MDWEGMLSLSSLVSLLDKNFFTKWLQVSEYTHKEQEVIEMRLTAVDY